MLRRGSPDEVTADGCAEAIRGLGALLRAGLPIRGALSDWHDHAPPQLQGPLLAVARRIRLGASTDDALAPLDPLFGAAAGTLRVALRVCSEAGGDAPRVLDRIAGAIQERAALAAAGRAAGSGALLSGRLVAGLPLAFVPLMPLARVPVFDRPGLVLILVGVALAVTGLRWVTSLMPLPPADDGAAVVADVTAALLDGGAGLPAALEIAARQPPDAVAAPMRRAARLVGLGLPWTHALERLDDRGLNQLAAALRASQKYGLPASAVLDGFSRRRRAELERSFEAAMRRAPVLMVIPLVLCVLPAYLFLGLGPFLRTLTLT